MYSFYQNLQKVFLQVPDHHSTPRLSRIQGYLKLPHLRRGHCRGKNSRKRNYRISFLNAINNICDFTCQNQTNVVKIRC